MRPVREKFNKHIQCKNQEIVNIKRIRKLGEPEQFFCHFTLEDVCALFISCNEYHVVYLRPGFGFLRYA